MNLNQIINMIIRMLTRRAVNFGITKGIDLASGKGKPRAAMSEAEQTQAADMREAAKRARKAANVAKRMMR